MTGRDESANRDTAPWRAALSGLVAAGTLSADQERQVASALEGVLVDPASAEMAAPGRGVRRMLGELAGYLGAALLLTGTAVLVAASWQDWSPFARALVLGAVSATALAGSAVAGRVGLRGGEAIGGGATPGRADGAVEERSDPADRERSVEPAGGPIERPGYRLRLSGALATTAAFAASGAVFAGLEPRELADALLLSYVAGSMVALACYALTRNALAHVVLVGYGLVVTGELVSRLDAPDTTAVAVFVVFGTAWVLLGSWRLLRETDLAAVAGGLVVLAALQFGFVGDAVPVVVYGLSVAVAVGAVVAYPAWRRWPLLALAVLVTTLAASQLAVDVFGFDSRGAAAALLVAGGVLSLGSVLAIRRHRGVPG